MEPEATQSGKIMKSSIFSKNDCRAVIVGGELGAADPTRETFVFVFELLQSWSDIEALRGLSK